MTKTLSNLLFLLNPVVFSLDVTTKTGLDIYVTITRLKSIIRLGPYL